MKTKPPTANKWYQSIQADKLSLQTKIKLAKEATVLRLIALGFKPYSPLRENGSPDLVIQTKKQKYLTLRFGYLNVSKNGTPMRIPSLANQTNSKNADYDFMIGYNLPTDTAYVFSKGEVADIKAGNIIGVDAKEAWNQIQEA